eukprot:scaffold7519_cov417-Prasinococcus_capsulatus_cf.AAC.4
MLTLPPSRLRSPTDITTALVQEALIKAGEKNFCTGFTAAVLIPFTVASWRDRTVLARGGVRHRLSEVAPCTRHGQGPDYRRSSM